MITNINTAAKIETIVLCYLGGNRTTRGTLGTLVEVESGRYRVEADGLTVIVRRGVHGWHVSFKGFTAIDSDLYCAASDALEAGAGRDVSTVAEALR